MGVNVIRLEQFPAFLPAAAKSWLHLQRLWIQHPELTAQFAEAMRLCCRCVQSVVLAGETRRPVVALRRVQHGVIEKLVGARDEFVRFERLCQDRVTSRPVELGRFLPAQAG